MSVSLDASQLENAVATENTTVDNAKTLEPMSLDLALPWYPNSQQEERFKKLLIGFLIGMLILLLIFTFSPVTEREKTKDDKIVAKTKVILEPVTIEEKKPDPPKPEPKPVPKEKPTEVKEKALATSKNTTKTPTEEPVSNGLNKVSDQLSALRNSFDLTRNKKKNLSTSDSGNKERATRTALGKDNVTKKSDGIKIDSEVMLDERTTLAAHNAAVVEGVEHGGLVDGSPVSRYATHMSGERTMESIRYTLEKNKGGIFTLYYQALNKTPGISGKYTFQLLIEPDGTISSLKLISSELGDEQLNRAILDRIKKIKFEEKDVIVARVTYTYNFIES